ncbi:MAG TPA: OmpA family protein [Polyangiaceae bacterium LLY-WYZ-14_1]|nr:OmpA family protein [Polyangiaceae bacterium LLY-WYZ-14_1]
MKLAPAVAAAAVLLGAVGCRPTYPACRTDDDCLDAEFCVRQQCQACRGDADCAPGERCTEGRCEQVEGACRVDGDCPAGAACVAGRCAPSAVSPREERSSDASRKPECQVRAVRFAFDEATLTPDARNALEANARCIRERDAREVTLVGHADPRGTEEYNLALGERRARAVEGFLRSLGLGGAEVSVGSMGEELARGEDEPGWARDRRVEIETEGGASPSEEDAGGSSRDPDPERQR